MGPTLDLQLPNLSPTYPSTWLKQDQKRTFTKRRFLVIVLFSFAETSMNPDMHSHKFVPKTAAQFFSTPTGNHIKLSWNIAKSLQTGQGSSNRTCALACTALVKFALHIPKTHLGPTHYTRNQIPKSFVQVSIEPRKRNSGPKR